MGAKETDQSRTRQEMTETLFETTLLDPKVIVAVDLPVHDHMIYGARHVMEIQVRSQIFNVPNYNIYNQFVVLPDVNMPTHLSKLSGKITLEAIQFFRQNLEYITPNIRDRIIGNQVIMPIGGTTLEVGHNDFREVVHDPLKEIRRVLCRIKREFTVGDPEYISQILRWKIILLIRERDSPTFNCNMWNKGADKKECLQGICYYQHDIWKIHNRLFSNPWMRPTRVERMLVIQRRVDTSNVQLFSRDKNCSRLVTAYQVNTGQDPIGTPRGNNNNLGIEVAPEGTCVTISANVYNNLIRMMDRGAKELEESNWDFCQIIRNQARAMSVSQNIMATNAANDRMNEAKEDHAMITNLEIISKEIIATAETIANNGTPSTYRIIQHHIMDLHKAILQIKTSRKNKE